MRVSVVVATYNGEKYIEEQLTSFFMQTMLPDEIIISDDGSKDKTLDVVRKTIDRYSYLGVTVKVLRNTSTKHGVNANFQNALNHISGDIVLFSDQDDIWMKNKVECIYNIFQKHKDIKLLVHNAQILAQNNDGFILTDKYFYSLHCKIIGNQIKDKSLTKMDKAKYFNLVLTSNLINGMCMACRRDFILSILPFPDFHFHDGWISFCAIYQDSFYACSDVLAQYRIHTQNTCGIIGENLNRRHIFDKIKTFDKVSHNTIRERYSWSTAVIDYTRNIFDDFSEELKDYYLYIACDRVEILKEHKVPAFVKLIKSYKMKRYHYDGIHPFIHDLSFVLLHSVRYRKDFLSNLSGLNRGEKRNEKTTKNMV